MIVDANAVLPFSGSVESLEVISRRGRQVAEFGGNIQLAELPLRHAFDPANPFRAPPGMKLFRLPRPERLNH